MARIPLYEMASNKDEKAFGYLNITKSDDRGYMYPFVISMIHTNTSIDADGVEHIDYEDTSKECAMTAKEFEKMFEEFFKLYVKIKE